MIGSILQFEDLQQLCQPGKRPRLATVVAWARRIDLRYTYDGKGGIITTLDAVNAAMGLKAANDTDAYRADEIF